MTAILSLPQCVNETSNDTWKDFCIDKEPTLGLSCTLLYACRIQCATNKMGRNIFHYVVRRKQIECFIVNEIIILLLNIHLTKLNYSAMRNCLTIAWPQFLYGVGIEKFMWHVVSHLPKLAYPNLFLTCNKMLSLSWFCRYENIDC